MMNRGVELGTVSPAQDGVLPRQATDAGASFPACEPSFPIGGEEMRGRPLGVRGNAFKYFPTVANYRRSPTPAGLTGR
jgi:hypothetical protein